MNKLERDLLSEFVNSRSIENQLEQTSMEYYKTMYEQKKQENEKIKRELEVHKKALLGLAIRVRESEKLTIPAETIAEIFLTQLGKELTK